MIFAPSIKPVCHLLSDKIYSKFSSVKTKFVTYYVTNFQCQRAVEIR